MHYCCILWTQMDRMPFCLPSKIYHWCTKEETTVVLDEEFAITQIYTYWKQGQISRPTFSGSDSIPQFLFSFPLSFTLSSILMNILIKILFSYISFLPLAHNNPIEICLSHLKIPRKVCCSLPSIPHLFWELAFSL